MKISREEQGVEIVNKESCSIGGCGGPGMCPSLALLIGLGVGTLIGSLSGIDWMVPVTTVVIGLILISGVYKRFLPERLVDRGSSSQRE